MFIGCANGGLSGDVFLEGYKSDGWEIDFVEDLEMFVVGNQVFCLAANGTIDKLVIIGIARNQIESPNLCDLSITIRLITWQYRKAFSSARRGFSQWLRH